MDKIPSGVSEVIAQRIKDGSKPQHRKDPFKVGLVIEGGLMRAVVSAGMLVGLQALHAKEAFDAVYSVSAGSCDGAYFISDQADYGTSVYYHEVNTRRFINPWRIFKGKPMVDLKYVVYQVLGKKYPLNTDKIINSLIPFHVYIASAKDAKVVDVSSYKTREEVLDALYYSCDLPILAGWPEKITQNVYYTDGGILVSALPLDQAIKDGCTHILVLLSRPDYLGEKVRTFMDKVALRLLERNFPILAKHYWDRFINYDKAVEEIHRSEDGGIKRPRIEAVHLPKGKEEIKGLEKRREVLIQGAKDGYEAVVKKFQGFGLKVDESIKISD